MEGADKGARAWYEFLLDPHLLLPHLTDSSAVSPSATELMALFLQQTSPQQDTQIRTNSTDPTQENAESPLTAGDKETTGENSNDSQLSQSSEKPEPERRRAARMLALATAAAVHWDLSLLSEDGRLPLPALQSLLFQQLPKTLTSAPDSVKEFASILRARHTLSTLRKFAYPSRAPPGGGLALPNQLKAALDPSLVPVPPEQLDACLKVLERERENSTQLLISTVNKSKMSELNKPKPQAFLPAEKDLKTFPNQPDWSQTEAVDECWLGGVARDAGLWLFFTTSWSEAAEMFSRAKSLLPVKIWEQDPKNESYLQSSQANSGSGVSAAKRARTEQEQDLQQLVSFNSNSADKEELDEDSLLDLERVQPQLAAYGRARLAVDSSTSSGAGKSPSGSGKKKGKGAKAGKGKEKVVKSVSKGVKESGLERLAAAVEPEAVQEAVSALLKESPAQAQGQGQQTSYPPLGSRLALGLEETRLVDSCALAPAKRARVILTWRKASDLRRAAHFNASRTLLVCLLEDVQACAPALADTLRHQLLWTDLEAALSRDNEQNCELKEELRDRALAWIGASQESEPLTEAAATLLLAHSAPQLSKMAASPSAVVRMAVALLARDSVALWDSLLDAFRPQQKLFNERSLVRLAQRALLPNNNANKQRESGKEKEEAFALLVQCCARMYNLARDTASGLEVWLPAGAAAKWPLTASAVHSLEEISLSRLSWLLRALLEAGLEWDGTSNDWMVMRADLDSATGRYGDALGWYTQAAILREPGKELVSKMVLTAGKLGLGATSAVLSQLNMVSDNQMSAAGWQQAFKALSSSLSASGGLVECGESVWELVWSVPLLELLVHLLGKRGERERRARVAALLGALELNANNSAAMLKEVARLRRARLLHALAKQFPIH